VPTTNECVLEECGDGGGGSFTGRVGIGGAVVVPRVVDGLVVVAVVPVETCVVVSVPAFVEAVAGDAWLSPPPLEESTIAATTPAIAATAITPASTAFLTGPEATLARPCLHLSKSS